MAQIELKVERQVAEITLARPDKLNAITPQMAADIERLCKEVDRDDAVKVVLVTGAGSRAFCAGSDLGSLATYPSPWDFRNRIEYAAAFRDLRKPVVAALKGWVLGGGASQMLPRLVGYGQAMRMLLTGEPIDASKALSLGLVEEVVEPGQAESRARDICLRLASFSAVAVQAVKAAVRTALSAPLEAGLRYENELNALCFHTGDHLEGIRAFQENRTSTFSR